MNVFSNYFFGEKKKFSFWYKFYVVLRARADFCLLRRDSPLLIDMSSLDENTWIKKISSGRYTPNNVLVQFVRFVLAKIDF